METEEKKQFEEKVINVNRCSKAVKGGRKMSFSAVVVVGNRKGMVGLGSGKAIEVSNAISKATQAAHKNCFSVNLFENTIPHVTYEKKCGALIMLRPAAPGTGIIAGSAMRVILELAGVKDVLAKSMGSNNTVNMAKATERALRSMRSYSYIMAKRGLFKNKEAKKAENLEA